MPNQQFQFVPGLKALHRTALSPLRSAKAAAEQRRYALKQMPLRQHAFVQDADNFNNILGG